MMSKTISEGKEFLEMSCEEENKLVDVICADYEIKGVAFKKLRDAEIKFRELERKIMIMKDEREKNSTTGDYCSLCSTKFRIFDRIKICQNCKCQVCKKCIDNQSICEYCRTKDTFFIKKKEFKTLCPYSNTEFGIHKFFCKHDAWRQRAKLEVHMARLIGDTFENCPTFVKIDDPSLNECFKRLQKEILDYAFSNELSYINSAYRDFYRQLNRLWHNIPLRMIAKNRFINNLTPVIKVKEESYPINKYYLSVAHAVAYKCEVVMREKLEKIEIEQQINVKMKHLSKIQRFPEQNLYKNNTFYQNSTNKYLKNSEQNNTLSKIPFAKIISHKMSMLDLSSKIDDKKPLSTLTRCSSVYETNRNGLFNGETEGKVVEVNDDNNYMTFALNLNKLSNNKKYNKNYDNSIEITMDRNKIICQSGRMVVVSCKIYCPKETIIKKDHITWLSAKNKLIEIGGKNQFCMDSDNLQLNGYYNLELILFDTTNLLNGPMGICALVNGKMYFNYCTITVIEKPFDTTEDCNFSNGIKIIKKDHGIIVVEAKPSGYPTPWVEFIHDNKVINEDINHKITIKDGIWYLEITDMIQATSINGQFSRSNLRNINTTLSSFEIVAIAKNRFGTATAKATLLGEDKKENQKIISEYTSSIETTSISSNSIV